MVKELYISVDVEADGPIPGPYSMTALGAVAAGICDYRNPGSLDLTRLDLDAGKNRFYEELAPISDDYVPEAMQVGLFSGFGKEQAELDPDGSQRRAYIEANGADPVVAMTQFSEWVQNLKKEYNVNSVVFAAYPLGFDWMWTYWYLMNFTGNSPFGHSRHYDMKTAYAEKAGKPIARSVKARMPARLLSKRPHTHLAVDDAAEQAELFMNILEMDLR